MYASRTKRRKEAQSRTAPLKKESKGRRRRQLVYVPKVVTQQESVENRQATKPQPTTETETISKLEGQDLLKDAKKDIAPFIQRQSIFLGEEWYHAYASKNKPQESTSIENAWLEETSARFTNEQKFSA